ncbi:MULTISPECIES: FGGY family carbohydrate kinase [unclassified Streptomyces]|uniref:FGGY-family carbohydrate kinase n=1 Tax=unclassified Streptomyces TaxID=2593676 RepID=UPI002E766F08|nr:FGGY family carbohydrate kinase [Streptomyces sp. JV190]MEE1843469.1 FGGY family carbohydrate kinase [Streptomyces sp. JV190]
MWMGIDLGTQSVRAVVAGDRGEILGSGSAPLTGRRDGVRHEQRPADWWTAVCAATRQALRDCPAPRALAVCATSGTVLLGDREGRPLTPGVMYDDGRAVAEAARAKAPPSWALPKVMWLLTEYGGGAGDAVRVMHQADLVLARLAGTPLPTDSSHALKTGYDLERDDWPRRRFGRLGLPDGLFPDVVRPGTRIGEVGRAAAEATGIPAGTAIVAGMTDGCAAQLASGSLNVGSWNAVLGTTLVLKGVTSSPVEDPAGVVYNHRAPDGSWLPGGASGVGGGVLTAAFPAVDPIRMDALARAHEPARVVAYPLVATGERFPFVAPEATGFLLGEPASEAEHWLALLTGVGLVERLCFDYLDLLGAQNYGRLTLTGGAARSGYWSRLRADILGRSVYIPRYSEPALGMAILAAYGAGPGTSLIRTAGAMVRLRHVLHPHPVRTAWYTEPYLTLVDELERRGWLPGRVAAHARTRTEGP